MQFRCRLYIVQSVGDILEQRVVKFVTSALQKGSYLLRSSPVQSSVRDVSADSGVEILPLNNLFFVMNVVKVLSGDLK